MSPEAEEDSDEVLDSPSSGHKRHHKHKKRHKHRRSVDDSEDLANILSSCKPTIKLKFKFAGQTVSEKSVMSPNVITTSSRSPYPQEINANSHDVEKDSSQGSSLAGNDMSDEEKEWLEALETGNLDELGMVRRSRDPALMTVRQRALVHGMSETDLHQLPIGYKTPELTDEQLKQRRKNADKRKLVAIEKREKDKKTTVDRLLKKQEAKLRVAKTRGIHKSSLPCYKYVNKLHSISLSIPHGYPLPLERQKAPEPPKPLLCGASGCQNVKKYSCSRTGVPLCSLQCYKLNISHLTAT